MSTLHSNFPTFSACKKFLFESVGNPEELMVENVCLLKIIQIGIKIPFSWKSLVDVHPVLSILRVGIRLIANEGQSYALSRNREAVRQKKIIAVDQNRISSQSKSKNLGVYLDALGIDDVAHFVNAEEGNILVCGALPTPDLKEKVPFRVDEAIYAWKVYRCISKLCLNNKVLRSYQGSINRSVELYLKQWLGWKRVLEGSNVNSCLLVCHYHNEGLIHACRDLGIKVIEVQHGVVLESSIFYVYPKKWKRFLSNSLFPDEIHVFGPFWKEKLLVGCEFESARIHVVGDVMNEIPSPQGKHLPSQNSLLVSSQTGMSGVILDYLVWLIHDCADKGHAFNIVIKPHPNETGTEYDELLRVSHRVKISNRPLPDLLYESELHLTIFSMTMFAALCAGKMNYCLHYAGRGDFQQELIDAGVARKLEPRANVFEVEAKRLKDRMNAEYFLSSLVPKDKLLKLIKQ